MEDFMKIILLSILIVSFCLTANAKTYVLRDKLTGKPTGTASISDKNIKNWAEDFILMEASKEYRGKQSHEIKYENGELRLATQEEIDDYLLQKQQESDDLQKAKDIEKLIELLNEKDIKDKIKDIKDEPVSDPIMMGTERNWRGKIKDYVVNIKNKITK